MLNWKFERLRIKTKEKKYLLTRNFTAWLDLFLSYQCENYSEDQKIELNVVQIIIVERMECMNC